MGYLLSKKLGALKLVKSEQFDSKDLSQTQEEWLFKIGMSPSEVKGSLSAIEYFAQSTPALTNHKEKQTTQSQADVMTDLMYENIADASTLLTDEEVAKRFENDRVVKHVPRFVEIATDTSRQNKINHSFGEVSSLGMDPVRKEIEYTKSEFNSVRELYDFLQEVEQHSGSVQGDSYDKSLTETAQDMLENITFIGEKERTEAIKGIAAHWKSYLLNNSEAQLCVLTETSDSTTIKSDKFLFDGILGEFTDEEMVQFGGRLLNSMQTLTGDPENVRIVLLDDWVISGSQIRKVYDRMSEHPKYDIYKEAFEIQLVTSARNRIESGVIMPGFGRVPDRTIPIRSYYLSHEANQTTAFNENGHKSYETGAHSSVDYDFEASYIVPMVRMFNDGKQTGPRRKMPATTRITRDYRSAPLTNIGRYLTARNSLKQSAAMESV